MTKPIDTAAIRESLTELPNEGKWTRAKADDCYFRCGTVIPDLPYSDYRRTQGICRVDHLYDSSDAVEQFIADSPSLVRALCDALDDARRKLAETEERIRLEQ